MWTKNFQMLKLDLEKAEEPEIKLPTSVGSSKKQESSTEMSTSALLTTPKPLTEWITTNWKFLHEMGIPDHLICLLRNLYACQEVTVRTERGTTDLFQIGKGVRQSCVLAPCLFNFYAEFSSVAQSCLTLCDSMDCSKPGFLVYHQLPKFTQTHVHWEKAVVTHSSTLAWKIPWTEEPGRLQSMGSWRGGH